MAFGPICYDAEFSLIRNVVEYDNRIPRNIIEQWSNRNLKFVSFGGFSDGHIQTWVGVGPDNSGNW